MPAAVGKSHSRLHHLVSAKIAATLQTLQTPETIRPMPRRSILAPLADRLTSIQFFVRQDLIDRYRTDLLGTVWLFLQPLIYIALFSAVFSTLMRARLSGVETGYGYTVYLIAGILAWNAFSQSLSRLSTWYRERAHLYRKVPMGLISPPVSVLVSELIIYLISMALFAIFLLAIGHPITWQWLWLAPILFLLLGIAYSIGLIGGMLEVFIPDLRRLIPIFLQLGFWLTPIVYTVDILPSGLQGFQQSSPFAAGIMSVHQVVVYGRAPDLSHLAFLSMTLFVSMGVFVVLHARIHKALRDAL